MTNRLAEAGSFALPLTPDGAGADIAVRVVIAQLPCRLYQTLMRAVSDIRICGEPTGQSVVAMLT